MQALASISRIRGLLLFPEGQVKDWGGGEIINTLVGMKTNQSTFLFGGDDKNKIARGGQAT